MFQKTVNSINFNVDFELFVIELVYLQQFVILRSSKCPSETFNMPIFATCDTVSYPTTEVSILTLIEEKSEKKGKLKSMILI